MLTGHPPLHDLDPPAAIFRNVQSMLRTFLISALFGVLCAFRGHVHVHVSYYVHVHAKISYHLWK